MLDTALQMKQYAQRIEARVIVERTMPLANMSDMTDEERWVLGRWVETIATTPARMFGLYPRKGIIAPGSDADIVLYDPNGRTRISVETHHMNMDHSAWEGWEIDGKVDTVLSRGEVIASGGEYTGRAGRGRYLKRGLSDYLL